MTTSAPGISDEQGAGLGLLAAFAFVGGVVATVMTNRKFGHPTFHRGTRRNSWLPLLPQAESKEQGAAFSGNRNGNGRSVFEGLPEAGLLEFIASFLSPADLVYYYYSWREAFFRAHRAKPHELLHELSCLPSSSSSAPAHQVQSPPPRVAVILHGRVLVLDGFLRVHPGGALILQEHAGTDASQAFERFFHSREARRIAKQYVVWDGEAIMGRRGFPQAFVANKGGCCVGA